MMPNSRNKTRFLIPFILVIFIFGGCAKSRPSGKIVAAVNGEPIYLKDFKQELALRVKQNPAFKISPNTLNEMLDIIIDKKLIIQEAAKRKLAEEERFVDTIRAFWEQTLIRDFVDYKNKETEKLSYVTDSEVEKYYGKLKTRTTFKVAKRTRKEDIELLRERAERGEVIEWDTTVSLSYEEIPSETLSKAFDLSPGQMGIFEEGYMYYLVYVVNREPISVPPLNEVYPRIKEKIRQRKQQEAFDDWLVDKRKESDIKIYTEVIREIKK